MGEQRENATVRRFLEAKSSPQGVEGEGYAPTRNDYVAGQGTFPDQSHPYVRRGVGTPRQRRYAPFMPASAKLSGAEIDARLGAPE